MGNEASSASKKNLAQTVTLGQNIREVKNPPKPKEKRFWGKKRTSVTETGGIAAEVEGSINVPSYDDEDSFPSRMGAPPPLPERRPNVAAPSPAAAPPTASRHQEPPRLPDRRPSAAAPSATTPPGEEHHPPPEEPSRPAGGSAGEEEAGAAPVGRPAVPPPPPRVPPPPPPRGARGAGNLRQRNTAENARPGSPVKGPAVLRPSKAMEKPPSLPSRPRPVPVNQPGQSFKDNVMKHAVIEGPHSTQDLDLLTAVDQEGMSHHVQAEVEKVAADEVLEGKTDTESKEEKPPKKDETIVVTKVDAECLETQADATCLDNSDQEKDPKMNSSEEVHEDNQNEEEFAANSTARKNSEKTGEETADGYSPSSSLGNVQTENEATDGLRLSGEENVGPFADKTHDQNAAAGTGATNRGSCVNVSNASHTVDGPGVQNDVSLDKGKTESPQSYHEDRDISNDVEPTTDIFESYNDDQERVRNARSFHFQQLAQRAADAIYRSRKIQSNYTYRTKLGRINQFNEIGTFDLTLEQKALDDRDSKGKENKHPIEKLGERFHIAHLANFLGEEETEMKNDKVSMTQYAILLVNEKLVSSLQ